MQMVGWLALVTSTSLMLLPSGTLHACAQACPTTEQLKLMTSEVFFNLMLLKQKQWFPGTRKAEETLKSDVHLNYFDYGEGLWAYA